MANVNKKKARRHRIGDPSEGLRSQVIETICSITGIDATGVGFLDLESSWLLVNEFHHTRARIQDAMFSLAPPSEVPCVYVTIPHPDLNRLRSMLRVLATNAGQAEIVLLGSHVKRAGALIVMAEPAIANLDRLMEDFSDQGILGICAAAMSGGLQFFSQEWSHDRSLQDDDAIYRVWHLFAWGDFVDWFSTTERRGL